MLMRKDKELQIGVPIKQRHANYSKSCKYPMQGGRNEKNH